MKFLVKLNLTFEVSGVYDPGVPAYIAGPPEACDPGEASDFEFHSVKLNGVEMPDALYAFIGDELRDAAVEEVERNHLDALDRTITA
jgi:hypothetical protein